VQKRESLDLLPNFPSVALRPQCRKLLENASPACPVENFPLAGCIVMLSLAHPPKLLSNLERLGHLQNHTAAACTTFLTGIVGAYGAFASSLAGAFCFVFEQVGGLDGHVDDIGVLQGEGKV
jgi:hypothetical protein